MSLDKTPRAWHREPLVWLVIAFPLAAVVGGVWTAWLAIRSDDGLVADDYYRQGLEINRNLSRDARAAALGLGLTIDHEGSALVLRLSGRRPDQPLAQARVFLRHATRSALDRSWAANAGADGVFRLPVPDLAQGRWLLHVEAEDWRLVGSLTVR